MRGLQFGSGNRKLDENISLIVHKDDFGKKLWNITKDCCKLFFHFTHLEKYQDVLEFNSIYKCENKLEKYNKNNSVIIMILILYLHMYKLYNFIFEENFTGNDFCSFGHSVGSFSSFLAAKKYDTKDKFLEEYKTAVLFALSCVVRSYICYQDKFNPNISDGSPMVTLNNISHRRINKLIVEFNNTHKVPIEISLINSHKSVVLSSSNINLKSFINLHYSDFQNMGVLINYLDCNIPFHSTLLNDAKESIRTDNQIINFDADKKNLRFPVLSTIDGSNYQFQDNVLDKLIDSLLCKCVNWTSVITAAISFNITEIIDFGPNLPVCMFTKDYLNNLEKNININIK